MNWKLLLIVTITVLKMHDGMMDFTINYELFRNIEMADFADVVSKYLDKHDKAGIIKY